MKIDPESLDSEKFDWIRDVECGMASKVLEIKNPVSRVNGNRGRPDANPLELPWSDRGCYTPGIFHSIQEACHDQPKKFS